MPHKQNLGASGKENPLTTTTPSHPSPLKQDQFVTSDWSVARSGQVIVIIGLRGFHKIDTHGKSKINSSTIQGGSLFIFNTETTDRLRHLQNV